MKEKDYNSLQFEKDDLQDYKCKYDRLFAEKQELDRKY